MLYDSNSIGFSGYFVRGFELLDTYVVANDNSLEVGSFASLGANADEIVGQKGDGAVVGFIPFQGYKGLNNSYESGEKVLVDIGNNAVYSLALQNGITAKRGDFIGIKKADGSLVFNADKAQVATNDVKDTGYKVIKANGESIHIKRV